MYGTSFMLDVGSEIWSWFGTLDRLLRMKENQGRPLEFVNPDDLLAWLAKIQPDFMEKLRSHERKVTVDAILADTENTLAAKKAFRRQFVEGMFDDMVLVNFGKDRVQSRILASLWAILVALQKHDDPIQVARHISHELQDNCHRWLLEGHRLSTQAPYVCEIETEDIATTGPIIIQAAMDLIPLEDPPMFR